jgi:hypothetical protein
MLCRSAVRWQLRLVRSGALHAGVLWLHVRLSSSLLSLLLLEVEDDELLGEDSDTAVGSASASSATLARSGRAGRSLL